MHWLIQFKSVVVVPDVRSITHPLNFACLTDNISVDQSLFAQIQARYLGSLWNCLLCGKQKTYLKGRSSILNPGILNAEVASGYAGSNKSEQFAVAFI